MNRVISGAAVLCFIVPGATGLGQTPSDPVERSTTQKAMYEDVEIFRRILDSALLAGPTHGTTTLDRFLLSTGSGPGVGGGLELGAKAGPTRDNLLRYWITAADQPHGYHHGLQAAGGAEGVYLKGYGIAYNMTIPWHFQQPVGDAPKSTPQARSRWDMIRSEMRGEKVEPTKSQTDRSEPAVADVVLKLLAENGKHFSHLRENEQITVAVTLRPMGTCTACHDVQASRLYDVRSAAAVALSALEAYPKGAKTESSPPRATASEVLVDGLRSEPVGPGAVKTPNADPHSQRTEAMNYIRLGEMRQKQGRLKDAIEAYHKAVGLYQTVLESQPKPDDKDLSQAADVAAKLAQVYMLTGDQEHALKSLQLIRNQQSVADRAVLAGPSPKNEPANPVPAKLVISATKRALDQVGEGKVSFEDFRKTATVEFLQFPAPEKPPEKPKP